MRIDPPGSPRGSNDNRPSPRSGRVFRKLWSRDVVALTAHLLGLDREQRAFRFGRAVSDEWIASYGASTDWTRAVILGCWIAGELHGIGEFKMLDGGTSPPSAEAALSVGRAFEAQGIGTELFHRGLVIARNRGIGRVTMVCLPENLRVRRIIQRVRPKLTFGADRIECEIDLAPPNALSIAAELCDDSCALAWSLWDRLAAA